MTSGSAPTVSVVVPAYNAERTVAAAIRSILRQEAQDFEVILVDDASTDTTIETVASFADPRIKIISREHRGGPAAARNSGIAEARGRYVSMLDSDDLWLPTYLAAMLETLEQDPRAGLAYTDAWRFDETAGRVARATTMARQEPPVPPPVGPTAFLTELVERNFVFSSVTVRRAVLDSVGGYREGRDGVEDYDLVLRIAAAGHRCLRPPGIHAVHRDHPGSVSTHLARTFESLQTVLSSLGDDHAVPAQIRERAIQRARSAEQSRRALVRPISLSRRLLLMRAWIGVRRERLLRSKWYREPPPEIAALLSDDANR